MLAGTIVDITRVAKPTHLQGVAQNNNLKQNYKLTLASQPNFRMERMG